MAAALRSFIWRSTSSFSSFPSFFGSICRRNAQVQPALVPYVNKYAPTMEVPNRSMAVWTDWRMIKNIKRRKGCRQYAPTVLRLNCLRKNKVLPKELREMADIDNFALPRISYRWHCNNRCVLTSKSTWVMRRWRLSRIMFRHYADYNYMSGIQRAMW